VKIQQVGRNHAWALLLALALAWVVHVALFREWHAFHTRMDFNTGPFEDFTGPYYRQALAMGEDARLVDWFLYPPSFACMLMPLGWVTQGAAAWIWLGALGLASAGLGWAGWRFLERPTWALTFGYSLCFALGFPWLHDLHWGQVSTLVWALTLGGLLALQRSRPWCGAGALSLAIAIKVFPAWFLLLPVLQRDGKTVARVTVLSVLWMVLLPLLVMGWPATVRFYGDWIAGLRHAFDSLFWVSEGSQFGPAVLDRLWNHPSGGLKLLVWGLPWSLAGWLVWLAKRCVSGGDPALAAVLLAVALPQVLAPSWAHYFVWLPWGIFVVGQRCSSLGARSLLVGAAGIMSTPFFFAVGGHPAYVREGWLLLASLGLPLALLWQGGVASILVDQRGRGVGQDSNEVQA